MIYLTLYWPNRQPPWGINAGTFTRFVSEKGHFLNVNNEVTDDDTLIFHSHDGRVDIVSHLLTMPCYVNGKALRYRERCTVDVGSLIHVARYTIVIEGESADETLVQTLGLSAESDKDASLSELEVILHNSLLHAPSHYEGEQNDILKGLEKEFRQALIWGQQTPQRLQPTPARKVRFAERQFDFELIQAQVKSATVTHCIFESPSLIHKVFDEHNIRDDDTFFQEEIERCDVLRILAPEEIHYDIKKRIPDLLVQEIYQADLDTLF